MATRRSRHGQPALDPVDIYNAEGEVVATFQSNSSLVVGDYGGGGSVGAANLRSIRKMTRGDEPELISGGGFGQSAWQTLTDRATAMYSWRRDPNEEEIAELVASDVVFVTGHYGYEQAFLRTTPRPLPRDEEVDRLDREAGLTEEEMDETEYSTVAIDLAAGLADYPLIDDETHSEVEHEWLEEAIDNMRVRDLDLSPGLRTVLDEDFFPTFNEEATSEAAALAHEGNYSHAEYDGMYVDWRSIGVVLRKRPLWVAMENAGLFLDELSAQVTTLSLSPLVGRGRLVDEHLRANLEEIFAALVEVIPKLPPDEIDEQVRRLPHTEDCDATTRVGQEHCTCDSSEWADRCGQLLDFFREKGLGEYLVQFIRRIGDVLEPHFPALSDELKGFGS